MDYSSPEHQCRKLVVSIDFGTAYSAVAYILDPRHAGGTTRSPALGDIPLSRFRTVHFDRRAQVSSQLAWYDREEQWVWGDAVDGLVERKEILESDRIQMFKLCLEHSRMTERTRERVQRQLDRLPPIARKQLGQADVPDFENLISLYLARLWAEAKRHISEAFYCSRGQSIFDGREVECWMGVPKFIQGFQYARRYMLTAFRLWSPELNEVMIHAAERARLPNTVGLVHEPEAAAILCLADQLEQSRPLASQGLQIATSTPKPLSGVSEAVVPDLVSIAEIYHSHPIRFWYLTRAAGRL